MYSYTERKIGSYFGADLYERCFDMPAYDSGYTIELDAAADKVINVDGFIVKNDESNTKIPFSYVLPPVTVGGGGASITNCVSYEAYDKTESENATVIINTNGDDMPTTEGGGIVKVQYTKVSE